MFVPRTSDLHVVDASACLTDGGCKEQQAEPIQEEIQNLLPVRGITKYDLLFANGSEDDKKLEGIQKS